MKVMKGCQSQDDAKGWKVDSGCKNLEILKAWTLGESLSDKTTLVTVEVLDSWIRQLESNVRN